jgi:fatty-acyl-CoA synthase
MLETQLSYVSGTSDKPLLFQTIGKALENSSKIFAEDEALVFCPDNLRMTYHQLNQAANEFAAGLLAIGLEPGDRLGIWSPNRPEWVITQFATAKIGVILVNINPAYRISELEHALNQVECKALVAAHTFKSSNYIEMIESLAPELKKSPPGNLRSIRLPSLRHVIVISDHLIPGTYRYKDISAQTDNELMQRLAKIENTLDPDQPINIQFTSGTTGLPKGATLSHFNIINNAYFVGRAMRFTKADRLCIPVPLYHCFGMVMGVLSCLTHGATMVFPGEGFDAGEVLQTLAKEKCTALHGVPTMFTAELAHPSFSNTDFSSLRTGVMAGAPCPIEVMKQVQTTMGMKEVTIAYGMTETSPVSFQSSTDDPVDKRVSTVGRVMPHVQVKIIDEEGRIQPIGHQGELCTRGYSVMQGYWGDQEKTDQAIDKNNWMRTGDLAVIDKDGYCNITGRVKDMIIRGGENIYPREIEEYLYRHPKIQDVAVFGVPDPRYGEAVATWIQLKPGESCEPAEIVEFCVGQIAHYKVPAYIEIVTEFPMTVTGKIQKFVMRDKMAEKFDLVATKSA